MNKQATFLTLTRNFNIHMHINNSYNSTHDFEIEALVSNWA